MDSYLEIARKVLLAARRPMTAKGILEAAYQGKIVPHHLFGKTQEKTLQARLSEDILHRRDRSVFYRTEPGKFFLSELASDPDIPKKYKEPFAARRRIRDLHRGPLLTINRRWLDSRQEKLHLDWESLMRKAEAAGALRYAASYHDVGNALVVWTYSVVTRQSEVLSYIQGRYRNESSTFLNKRTIGFPGTIGYSDSTLFSTKDWGASENALSILTFDLDISASIFHGNNVEKPRPVCALQVPHGPENNVLLVVLQWSCPEWYEPTTKRLSLNDPRWTGFEVSPDALDIFEPWALATLEAFRQIEGKA